MSELNEQTVRQIVREETSDMRTEITSLGVQFEALDSKVDTVLEILTPYVQSRSQTEELGQRMDRAEADIDLLKLAIKKRP